MRLALKILISIFALFGACIVAAYIYFYWAFNIERSCFDVVSYGLGDVSSGHELSRAQILNSVQSAEAVFEAKYGGDVLVYQDENPDIQIDIKYNEYYQKVVTAVKDFNNFSANNSANHEAARAEIERLKVKYEQGRQDYIELNQEYEIQKLVLENAREARSNSDITESEYDAVYARTEAARAEALDLGLEVNTLSADIRERVDQVNSEISKANEIRAEAVLGQEVINSNNVPDAFSLFPKPNSVVVEVEYFADSEQLTQIVSSALATVVKPDGYDPQKELLEGTPLHEFFGVDISNVVFEVCQR